MRGDKAMAKEPARNGKRGLIARQRAARTRAPLRPSRPPLAPRQAFPAFDPFSALFHPQAWTEAWRTPGFAAAAGDESEAPKSLDRLVHAALGRATFAVSPVSLGLAYADWALQLASSPGKQQALVAKAARKATRFSVNAARTLAEPGTAPCIEPLPQDHRFTDPAWRELPFRFIYESFLLTQQWWHNATTNVHGVSHHHQQVVSFVARQLLDMISPSNFIVSNPQLLRKTIETGGQNLVQGAINAVEDWERAVAGRPPVGSEAFRPGETVAVTPGQVVYRNRLIELIQYAPATAEVHAEPMLILPAWIMKYYILDLSPQNSLVKYLVERGHTVFMVSWRNPGTEDRDLAMDDYLRLGLLEAVKAVQAILPGRRINAAGYCLGGTLLAIGAAYLARQGMTPLNSVTTLAAQTDFTDAGELTLFIDESQIAYLEDLMWDQGYLDSKQMSGAFQLLHSADLVWSRLVRDYLMGEREEMTDLMAWNADATRMPYRMHSEYLRRLFLNNDLAEGRFEALDRPVALSDIRIPLFAVSTETDHVAPWRSVYKIQLLTDTDVTFLLTSGGHNAGIISEPGHLARHYRISTRKMGEPYRDADDWYAATPESAGSWWPVWAEWVESRMSGKAPPPALGATEAGYPPLAAAPGTYVLQD